MSIGVRLEVGELDPVRESAQLLDSCEGAGALVTFTGLARPTSPKGAALERLVLDHHPVMTEKSLQDIAEATVERFNISHVRVVHRTGAIQPGQAIVFVGTISEHRRAAFEAADYLMDRLKTDAVFWKREVGPSGSCWVEPTDADYTDRSRWE